MQLGTYRIIPVKVPNGTVIALVSPKDYDRLAGFKWQAQGNGYAARNLKRDGEWRRVSMHREIVGLAVGDPREVDHINRDRLDNRRENLRVVTKAQNGCNRGSKPGSASRFRGVYATRSGKWTAQAKFRNKAHCLGTYALEEDAAAAVNAFWEDLGHPAPNGA